MSLAQREWLVNAKKSPEQITLFQWNCLADWASYPEAFPNVPPKVLSWEYRKPLILAEITKAAPDIICLQEVDHFDEIAAALGEKFTGQHFPKGSTPEVIGKDGAAIFWRDERFDLRDSKRVHHSVICDQPNMSQIVARVILESRNTDPAFQLRIATTHLKAKGEFESVRQKQSAGLVEFMSSESGTSALTILCGDFNTTPDSEAIQHIYESGFKSAYRELRKSKLKSDSEPAWTTWKIRERVKKQAIDFVFFQSETTAWEPVDVWCMPDESLFDPKVALPSNNYPSDHCALAVRFQPSRILNS